jgi:hypothetical protein
MRLRGCSAAVLPAVEIEAGVIGEGLSMIFYRKTGSDFENLFFIRTMVFACLKLKKAKGEDCPEDRIGKVRWWTSGS